MYNPFRDYRISTKKKVKKLEENIDKLQQVVDALLEELGYKVTISVYDCDWNDYGIVKVDKEKKDE